MHNDTDRHDGTRCVIVHPGDVLILSGIAGITEPHDSFADAMHTLKDELGLRAVIVCNTLADVDVRNFDAELADAREELRSLTAVLRSQNVLNGRILDERDQLMAELADVRQQLATGSTTGGSTTAQ